MSGSAALYAALAIGSFAVTATATDYLVTTSESFDSPAYKTPLDTVKIAARKTLAYGCGCLSYGLLLCSMIIVPVAFCGPQK